MTKRSFVLIASWHFSLLRCYLNAHPVVERPLIFDSLSQKLSAMKISSCFSLFLVLLLPSCTVVAGSELGHNHAEFLVDDDIVSRNVTSTNVLHRHHRMTQTKQTRIIGGNRADPGEFPCYVQGRGCGGVLISNQIVLTAAHCNGNSWNAALVGAYRNQKNTQGAERIEVARSIKHPKYNPQTEAFDYRIVKLKHPVRQNQTFCRINHQNNYPSGGSNVVTVGMGVLTSNSGGIPGVLQKTTVQMVSYEDCKDAYYPDSGWIKKESMICAASLGKDSCNGDSGRIQIWFRYEAPFIVLY
jgi:hypothetical protein